MEEKTKSKALTYGIAALATIVLGTGLYWAYSHKQNAEEPATAAPSETAAPADSAATAGTEAGLPAPTETTTPPGGIDLTVDPQGLSKSTAIIETSKGVIKFKFYSADAPKTTERIVQLIQQGFYNGLNFHRVIPGFVIQGGDPKGDGTGGSGQKLAAEFNSRKHVEGAVAMARAQDPNSADSQFYICLGTHPHLDNQYTIFGQVTEGLDVVKSITMGDVMTKVKIETSTEQKPGA